MAHDDRGEKLTGDDVARLSEHLGRLTAANLPLGPGLRAAADEMSRGALSRSLRQLADALDRGATIEEAVTARGSSLPDHLRGLVLIGAKTGKTAEVLGRVVEFTHAGVEVRRTLLLSLIYPALLMAFALLLLTFVCTSLIGSFEAIFKDFGVPLPALTIVLLSLAHMLSLSWTKVIGGMIGLAVLLGFSVVILPASKRRSMLSAVPILGSVWRNMSLSEFCYLLSVLLKCEVPLGDAVRLTGAGVRDTTMEQACASMGREVDAGLSLGQAVGRRHFFPKGLSRILRWAEGHRSLAEALEMLGEIFESRARSLATLTGTILGVVAVVSILSAISIVVVALFLPLISLIHRLSG